jgi:serine/threonine protein phosphatase PrpC
MSSIEESYYSPGRKNQDLRFIVKKDKFTAYIVLDGHGPYGHEFVRMVEQILYKKLAIMNDAIGLYETFLTNIITETGYNELFYGAHLDDYYKEFLNRLFSETNSEMMNDKYNDTGAAMTVVIITPKRMYVANVGNSDAYLFTNDKSLMKLTTTHTGLETDEMNYLKLFPCVEIFNISNKKELKQTWHPLLRTLIPFDPRFDYMTNEAGVPITYICYMDKLDMRCPIMKTICISRSIGDYFFKSVGGIRTEPTIRVYNKPISNEVLLIGSDGFWNAWKMDILYSTILTEPFSLFSKSDIFNKTVYNEHSDDNSLILVKFQ